jgi:aminobenzoyl-glutamate transport protein
MLTEITNGVLTAAGMKPIAVTHNLYFGIVSTFLLTIVALLVTMFVTEKRLGAYDRADDRRRRGRHRPRRRGARAEVRGWALLGFVLVILALTLPPGAAARTADRRHRRHQSVHGEPRVHHLAFLVCGVAYGYGRRRCGADPPPSARSPRRSARSAGCS